MDEYDKYTENSNKNPVVGGLITFVNDNFIDVKTNRVIRGGGWASYRPGTIRVAIRGKMNPASVAPFLGFRCAANLPTA